MPAGNAATAGARHVLMTADAVGGVWTYALELARGLGECGTCVSLAVMGPSPDSRQRSEAAALPSVNLLHRPYALEWMDDPWRDVDAAGHWLTQIADDIRPDVIHLNGYCHAALPWKAPVVAVGHSCVLSWWDAVHRTPPPPSFDRYAETVGRGLRCAAMVVAPSATMLAALQRHYGALPRGRVIPNGRTLAADPSATPGLNKEPFILTSGRLWDRAKNVQALCAVAGSVPWPIRVAGESAHPNGATTSFGGVECLGRMSPTELAAWMSRASIYALPARYEPFGLSVLEAALSGCALVLGDIESLREIWNDAAVFVEPDDEQQLAASLRWLSEDDVAREALADRARTRAAALTPERMTESYCDAYRTVLPLAAV